MRDFTPMGSFTDSLGSTSSSLLRRVKSGDADAWQRLVNLYGSVAFVWCRRAGLDSHDAADVVQETFLAVVAHLARFRREGPEHSFRGWFWTITRNHIYDHFRRRQAAPQAQGGTTARNHLAQIPEARSESEAAEDPFWGMVERRALNLIRHEFEVRTWNAFWQTAVEGRTAAEVGENLGMSKGAVRQSKYRVLRRLREELEGLLD